MDKYAVPPTYIHSPMRAQEIAVAEQPFCRRVVCI